MRRMREALSRFSNKTNSRTQRSFTRSGLKLELVYQEPPHRYIENTLQMLHYLCQAIPWTRDNIRSFLSELKRKRTDLLFNCSKSSFQMKVNFTFHLEMKIPRSGVKVERHRILVTWSPTGSFQSPTGSFQSKWWLEVLSSPKVIYLEIFKHCMLPCFLMMLISFSRRIWHLPTVPKLLRIGLLPIILLCLIGHSAWLAWTP